MNRHLNWRTATVALLLIALLTLIAACGGGDDPTPTPTPAATPQPAPATAAATPAPTPTPAPATPAPTPAPAPATPAPTPTPAPAPEPTAPPAPPSAVEGHVPMGDLRDLIITPKTLGSEILNPLSADEIACIIDAVGEPIYEVIKITPIAAAFAGASGSTSAFFFECLTVENVVLMSVAFLGAQAGGWSTETRDCIINYGLEHPDAILVRMGVDWGGAEGGEASETLDYNVLIYNCQSSAEKQMYTIALWAGIDRTSTATGADIVDLLSEEELACVQRDLSPDQLQAIYVSTPLVAITIGNEAGHCLQEETNHNILVQGIHWGLGGISDQSQACIVEFIEDHPPYLALIQSGLENMAAMDPDEFIAIADTGTGTYACMTDDELARVQESATMAMQSQ